MYVTYKILNPEDIPGGLPPGPVIAGHFVVESVDETDDGATICLRWHHSLCVCVFA